MLYQALFAYKYDNGGRPTRVNVDELGNYPDDYVYRILDGGTQPEKVLISDLQSEVSGYTIYCVDEDGHVIRAPKSRTLETSWADKMIRSYQKLHPEQAVWFDMITVDTIADRDALQYDSDFAPESWVRVKRDENGESHEYVLAANRQFWVDPEIIGVSEASGKIIRDELYSRLSSGYLYDTFGPAGQNRTQCDFVYAVYADNIKGDINAATWAKTGDTLRWDFGGGTIVDSTDLPTHTMVDGEHTVTFSSTDGFSNVSKYEFSDSSFSGAIPRLDFTNVTNINSIFAFCRFSGPLPPMDTSKVISASIAFNTSLITSCGDFDFRSLTETSSDIFADSKLTNKIGKLDFSGTDVGLFGLFLRATITSIDQDISFGNNRIASMFWECDNLIDDIDIGKTFTNLRYINTLVNSADEDANPTFPNYARFFTSNSVKDLSFIKTLSNIKYKYHLFNYGSYRNEHVNVIPYLDNSNIHAEHIPSPEGIFLREDTTPNLSSGSIDNQCRALYEHRFLTKANTGDAIIFSNLQTLTAKLNGVYRDVDNPKYALEYFYKLVENPQNEDINKYVVLYNPLSRKIEKNSVEMLIQINSPGTVSFSVYNTPVSSPKTENSIRIDWGDGSITNKIYDVGLRSSNGASTYSHNYDAAGEYTIKISGSVFDQSFPLTRLGYSGYDNFSGAIRKTMTLNSTITLANSSFRGNTSEEIRFNRGISSKFVISKFGNLFRDCTSLKHIDPFYVCSRQAGDTSSAGMFVNTGSIESVVMYEMDLSFDISDNQLNDVALNALFEGLADVTNYPQTVTVTGNPGVGTGVYDPTIATNKGWTVVDA